MISPRNLTHHVATGGATPNFHHLRDTTARLADGANLLAIEPYGHGATRATYKQFTYWDSAIASLQVLDALKIPRAFALGTSQGGWMVAMMAMLAPEKIKGIIQLATSLDYESPRSRDLGCWDCMALFDSTIDELAKPVGEDWVVPDEFVDTLLGQCLSDKDSRVTHATPEERAFWLPIFRRNYAGDAGRERLRLCSVNLRDRDGLHARAYGIRCPVLRMQGTVDQVYSLANAKDEMRLLVNAPAADLVVVEDGVHFLNISNPREVNEAIIRFVKRWA